ncbi:MOSC domain-containing protein YiiM [Bacillus mesophilus]|uniref:MOSC domain-containing protein n=1 Tax=Bacillus mesophilus TaxID=1808955 RepID=A0A6M0QC13_9BACI|nr:MOSC domain-containing protein [Bacillus mesophilus]MBM7663240.1 MOSC domain-containing protein YiiM [Bacillus mesophilus]NEY73921.1 MOSC domain-containing protein [Bacillus mesophilus]
MLNSFKIKSLNIGKPKKIETNNHVFISSVGRNKVSKAFLSKQGFEDDSVQYKYHGGPDRAVLFYSYEHYQKWENEYTKEFTIPGFGENITVSGLSEENVKIGDIYQIGETMVQITQPRIPCDNLSKYNEVKTLHKRLVDTGYTGFLASVIKEGWIEDNSPITLIESPKNSITVLEANHIFFHDKKNKDRIEYLLTIPELADEWKGYLNKRLEKLRE